MDLDTQQLLIILGVLLISLAWHESAHAFVANLLGDPTARQQGRLSLNPLRHLDPFLSFILPVVMYWSTGFAIAGGKPVPINPSYFKHKARDFMFVALAGPFSNLVLAALLCVLFVVSAWTGLIQAPEVEILGERNAELFPSILGEPRTYFEHAVKFGVLINVLLAIFNLVPLPPLDGSRVIGWLLPRAFQPRWYALDRVGLLLVLVFFFALNGFEVVMAVVEPLFAVCAFLTDWLVTLNPLA